MAISAFFFLFSKFSAPLSSNILNHINPSVFHPSKPNKLPFPSSPSSSFTLVDTWRKKWTPAWLPWWLAQSAKSHSVWSRLNTEAPSTELWPPKTEEEGGVTKGLKIHLLTQTWTLAFHTFSATAYPNCSGMHVFPYWLAHKLLSPHLTHQYVPVTHQR